MNGNEAFMQLIIKVRRIMEAYKDGNNSSVLDMAENGQFLYDNLEELVKRAEHWEIEE